MNINNNDKNDNDLLEKCTIKEWNNLESTTSDMRKCYLCHMYGDDDKCGRLISFDLNWIHANCLIWSQDIYSNDYIVEQIQTILSKNKNSVRNLL